MGTAKFAGLAFGVAAVMSVAMSPAALAQDKAVSLRWASFVSPKSVNNAVSVPAFAKAIEKASEGTLKIELYAGGTLGKGPVQQLSMVENAVADIAEVVVAYSPGRFPELSIFELPFLVKSNLLIHDTPPVGMYVLNMFRMRGSRLWGSRLHRACVV